MTSRFAIAAAAVAALAGCGRSAPPLEAGLEARARTEIARTVPPGAANVRSIWLARLGSADGLVCGRIAAPPMLRDRREDLRFVYEDRSRHGQIEYHEGWVGDATGTALIEQNRRIFDEIWERSCAPAEPRPSWMAGLFT